MIHWFVSMWLDGKSSQDSRPHMAHAMDQFDGSIFLLIQLLVVQASVTANYSYTPPKTNEFVPWKPGVISKWKAT